MGPREELGRREQEHPVGAGSEGPGIYTGYMGVSKNRVPQNRPNYIVILITRTAKVGPLLSGKASLAAFVWGRVCGAGVILVTWRSRVRRTGFQLCV